MLYKAKQQSQIMDNGSQNNSNAQPPSSPANGVHDGSGSQPNMTGPLTPPSPASQTMMAKVIENDPGNAANPATAHPRCPTCGEINRVGSLICENCGSSLVGEQAIVGTKRFVRNAEGELVDDEGGKLSTDEVNALGSAGSAAFEEDMILRLEVEGAATPILVFPKGEIALGRRDPATGTMPDVDLTAFAAYRLGVSRKHAIIRQNQKKLEIYDLGSSNGTSVNGVKLASHQPHPLRDGDTIALGKMLMRAMFLQAKRPELAE